MSSRPSQSSLRARRLLAGGVIGGHVAALLSVAGFLLARGVASAVSAAIAAVVVGGVAISGGRGSLWGVFAGLLLLACIAPAPCAPSG